MGESWDFNSCKHKSFFHKFESSLTSLYSHRRCIPYAITISSSMRVKPDALLWVECFCMTILRWWLAMRHVMIFGRDGQCGKPHIFWTCIWENFRGTAFQKIGEYYDKSFALDGYTIDVPLSISCSLKRASSALLYVLLQLTQNLASWYKDRNVLVDWQRGQFVNLGFNSDFFCNLSHVSNIVNPLMVLFLYSLIDIICNI